MPSSRRHSSFLLTQPAGAGYVADVSTDSQVVIYHISRSDGTPLFLHPITRTDDVLKRLPKAELVGRYGREPRVESLTLLRNELYRLIETAVKEWIGEARFIPRFVLAAVVFLVSYLFMSLVIRDPLPLVDELLIAGGAAVATYIVIGRRNLQSDPALRRRIQLRERVDGVYFSESEFVMQVEKLLNELEQMDPADRVLRAASGQKLPVESADRDDVNRLLDYIEHRFAAALSRRKLRDLRRFVRGDAPAEKRHATLRRLAAGRGCDSALLGLYAELSSTALVENPER